MSSFNYFIEYDVIDLILIFVQSFNEIKSINVNYDEKSNFNKRSHENEIIKLQQLKNNTQTQIDRTRRKSQKNIKKQQNRNH